MFLSQLVVLQIFPSYNIITRFIYATQIFFYIPLKKKKRTYRSTTKNNLTRNYIF